MGKYVNFLGLACLIAAVGGGAGVSAGEKITVGGSGSAMPLAQEIARILTSRQSEDTIEILPSSLAAAGGLKATAEGRIQVGLIARKPEADELKYEVTWKVYAVVPSVLAVHGSVPATSLTETQILDVYAGRITNWAQLGGPDARIVVLTRNEADANKRAWRVHLKGFRDLPETREALMLVKDQQMLDALKNQPYSIGFTDTIAVANGDGRLRALAVNGIAPTPDNARSGRYRILKEFVVVTKGEPRGLARSFVDLLLSAEGQRVIARLGAVPVR